MEFIYGFVVRYLVPRYYTDELTIGERDELSIFFHLRLRSHKPQREGHHEPTKKNTTREEFRSVVLKNCGKQGVISKCIK